MFELHSVEVQQQAANKLRSLLGLAGQAAKYASRFQDLRRHELVRQGMASGARFISACYCRYAEDRRGSCGHWSNGIDATPDYEGFDFCLML